MTDDRDRTHFFGDDCEGGHWDDPQAAPQPPPPPQTITFETAESANEGRDM